MQTLLDQLWEHRDQLCGGKGVHRNTSTMQKILEANFGAFRGSQALQFQRLVIRHLADLSPQQLSLVQRLIPHLYLSSYSVKAWYVPVSAAANGTNNVRQIKHFMSIEHDADHRAMVRTKLEHKNRHRLDVNVDKYVRAMLEWSQGETLAHKCCAFLSAVGCRRSEMIDPFILFEFEGDTIVTQLGVHKSRSCITLRKKCLLPGMQSLLAEIRAEGMGRDKTRREIGDLSIWPKCIALIRGVIPGGTCHTLRSVYIALTYDNRSSFTSYVQQCCGHASLETALHYQGVRLK